MGFESQDVERKVVSILKVLGEQQEPLGARLVARRLKDYGVELSERAVRYHLKLMDERGLTKLAGKDGRLLTELGVEETRNALARDRLVSPFQGLKHLPFAPALIGKNVPVWFRSMSRFSPRKALRRHSER